MTAPMLETADRIRRILTCDPNMGERKMFGGVCFLLNGNMLCGANKDGKLMLRVGKEQHDAVQQMPHTSLMNFTGRVFTGYAYVEPDGFTSDEQLENWLAIAIRFVASLPPKG